jgi:hypothetical protein
MGAGAGATGAAGLALLVMVGCNLGSAPVSYDAPGRDVAAGDIDGDGDVDLVSIGWGHKTGSGFDYSDSAVFLGDGTGQFSVTSPESPTDFDTSGGEIELVDVDGDGDLDQVRSIYHVVGGAYRDDVGVRLGNGDGTFGDMTIVSSPTVDRFDDLDTGDVNGDGFVDVIALANQNQGISVFRGDGTGAFPTVSTFLAGAPLGGTLALADIDGDGDLDVASTGEMLVDVQGHPVIHGTVYVVPGDGTGQFAGPPEAHLAEAVNRFPDGRPFGITLADFDEDGRVDIATATRGDARVLLGQPGGTFGPQTSWDTGLDCRCSTDTTSADIDGDGNTDVIVLDHSGGASVLYGNGDGGFPATREIGVGAHLTESMITHDLTGDGKADLVAAGSCWTNDIACQWPPQVGVSVNSIKPRG